MTFSRRADNLLLNTPFPSGPTVTTPEEIFKQTKKSLKKRQKPKKRKKPKKPGLGQIFDRENALQSLGPFQKKKVQATPQARPGSQSRPNQAGNLHFTTKIFTAIAELDAVN